MEKNSYIFILRTLFKKKNNITEYSWFFLHFTTHFLLHKLFFVLHIILEPALCDMSNTQCAHNMLVIAAGISRTIFEKTCIIYIPFTSSGYGFNNNNDRLTVFSLPSPDMLNRAPGHIINTIIILYIILLWLLPASRFGQIMNTRNAS